MRKKTKIIQVPVPEDLLEALDRLSSERGESRSSVIREACAEYIASVEEAEADRRYVESYRKYPEDPALGITGARLATEAWEEEDWSADYAEDTAPEDASG